MPSDKHADKVHGEKNTSVESKSMPENFESREAFQHIIRLAKTSQPPTPPAGFTAKVMARIAAGKRRPLDDGKIREAFNKINIRRWTEVADQTECALCFFTAGFFYFVLGLVLIMGVTMAGGRIPLAAWIVIQPQLAFIIALGFFAIGIILMKKSDSAIKIAQIGTIIYIGFSIFNVIGIQRAPANPFSAAGLICFAGAALILGVFLMVIVQRYQARWTRRSVNFNH